MNRMFCIFMTVTLLGACTNSDNSGDKTRKSTATTQSGQTQTSPDRANNFLTDFQSIDRKFSTKGQSVLHGENTSAFLKLCDLGYSEFEKDKIFLEFSKGQNAGKLYCGTTGHKVTFTYDVLSDSALKFANLEFDKDSQKDFAFGATMYSTAAAIEKSVWLFNKNNNSIETVFAYDPTLLDRMKVNLMTGELNCPFNDKIKSVKEAHNCGPLTFLEFKSEP